MIQLHVTPVTNGYSYKTDFIVVTAKHEQYQQGYRLRYKRSNSNYMCVRVCACVRARVRVRNNNNNNIVTFIYL